MATITAKMMIGRAHPYDGGIILEYYLFLSENGIAGWTLVEENLYGKKEIDKDQRIAQWIPTIEHMLEDAMLMVGLYVLKDTELTAVMERYFNKVPRTAELYTDIPSEELGVMRSHMKMLEQQYKVSLTVYEGSTLMGQLSILEKYPMDIEVCVPIYLREYNVWSQEMNCIGNLKDYKRT